MEYRLQQQQLNLNNGWKVTYNMDQRSIDSHANKGRVLELA